MLLDGKRLLVTGALNDRSIAYATARLAQQQGAEVILTGFGRGLRITRYLAEKLEPACDVLELDATQPEHLTAVAEELDRRWGRLDGILHAIAFAPPGALGGNFLTASWDEVGPAVQVSTYSFVAFGRAFAPLLAKAGGGSLVGVDFDARQAWPGYDWMGVAKAGLESSCRYLAHALGGQGTRVNLVAAGPLRTVAATAISSFDTFEAAWQQRAPLGWDVQDTTVVARAICALWSDWLPAVTGEVIHVDGGAHAVAGGTIR
ncbi:enoyl-ACP reductase FabI [Micromonospora siamensis]|uniref:Enoyl-[acyl-carrier-protein] reductase [NADH] n=1 Tax=Micromonospora siamensis TaxID=299152 RepID=A0A1C5HUH1_9ACTN|nr:enoyl-ACP reductase FabI [Micromonospora siamensis]SCG49666.1 Enoyl-[acyl-carrier-protein] reductase [NADH] [Micromonospora siamensis]